MQLDRYWDKEEIYFDSAAFFAALEAGLAEAKYSIELETYIFTNDELGQRIGNQLKEAARRGVRTRVMVDGFGSPAWASEFLPQLLDAGVDARVYHPLPWLALRPYLGRYPSLARFFTRLTTLNERNHRKVCIVDRRRAWSGGMNISAAHAHWRDTGIYIEGRSVQTLFRAFVQTWHTAWSVKKSPHRRWRVLRRNLSFSRLVRLNSGIRARRHAYRGLLDKIRGATHKISITNAYFVPPQNLLAALSAASWKGVAVRVLVPAVPDVFFIHAVSSALYYGLLKSGVRIFEYLPEPLHAKTLVIDNWAIVGSSNLNHRSIFHDLEIDIVMTSSASIQTLADKFNDDLKNAREFTLADWKRRSPLQRLAGRLLLLFRYWI